MSSTTEYQTLADVPGIRLEELSRRSYFFGHQSVGQNIVEGLEMVTKDHPEIDLRIVSLDEQQSAGPGVFLHSLVGRNRDPDSKIQAFGEALHEGLGNTVDAAFMKFCYLDITHGVNVEAIFDSYLDEVKQLKQRYPSATIVHFTAPLEAVPVGVKATIKRMIGREISEEADDAARARFNDLMRNTFAGREPLFDLAELETVSSADRTTSFFLRNGERIESMAAVNTVDGGHLSDVGKRWIAEQLIIFLSNLQYATSSERADAARKD